MTDAEKDALIKDLQDKIEGLTEDLNDAVSVAIKRGAVTWGRLNYPGHPDLLKPAVETLPRADVLRLLQDATKTRQTACYAAVASAWAPVTGTPYSVGPRAFCEAIEKKVPAFDAESFLKDALRGA